MGSIYLCGVAVECMFRAYKTRNDPQFSGRHDLQGLMKQSGILHFVREPECRQFGANLSTLWSLWKNNLRYAETSRLESHYTRLGIRSGKKQTRIKTAAESAFEAATDIVNKGKLRWNSKRR